MKEKKMKWIKRKEKKKRLSDMNIVGKKNSDYLCTEYVYSGKKNVYKINNSLKYEIKKNTRNI